MNILVLILISRRVENFKYGEILNALTHAFYVDDLMKNVRKRIYCEVWKYTSNEIKNVLSDLFFQLYFFNTEAFTVKNYERK